MRAVVTEPDEPNTPSDETAPDAVSSETAAANEQVASELSAEQTEDPATLIAWCREHAGESDALPRLNSLHDALVNLDLAKEAVRAATTIVNLLIQQPEPGPVAQAHMIILLGRLLTVEKLRDDVDLLLIAWMKHPSTFGSGRATPADFQRPEFVQRVADLIGWGTLEVVRDGEALGRFFSWVNTWAPKQKREIRRTVEMLRRVFPAPDLWKRVKLF